MNQRTPTATVWLAAAENGAVPGGKVGGVADVLRDLPPALAGLGWSARVITPAYGVFHTHPGARLHRMLQVPFRGHVRLVRIFELPATSPGVSQFVAEHPLLVAGEPGQVYFQDPDGRAFETDSNRFAFFSAVIAAWITASDTPPEVLHLHDWHAGLVPLLLEQGGSANRPRVVFTIHNLAYQGVRPLEGHSASLQAWFPNLDVDEDRVQDPQHVDCVNFMATAVRNADRINTVSPSYAREILLPSSWGTGFFGGEGLEEDLLAAEAAGRLSGILNGCEYPPDLTQAADWTGLFDLMATETNLLAASPVQPGLLEKLRRSRPDTVLLSIGRVAEQKVALLLEPVGEHASALDALLFDLGGDGLLILLGSGEEVLEDALAEVARRNSNFLFLRGYAEKLAGPLYANGDLFIMPSSFEPCGISQMLAMRAGQPCVVHAVGGLRDTVKHLVTGFVFDGSTPRRQAMAMIRCVAEAVALQRGNSEQWQAMRAAAGKQRFSWALAARRYIEEVYTDVG